MKQMYILSYILSNALLWAGAIGASAVVGLVRLPFCHLACSRLWQRSLW